MENEIDYDFIDEGLERDETLEREARAAGWRGPPPEGRRLASVTKARAKEIPDPASEHRRFHAFNALIESFETRKLILPEIKLDPNDERLHLETAVVVHSALAYFFDDETKPTSLSDVARVLVIEAARSSLISAGDLLEEGPRTRADLAQIQKQMREITYGLACFRRYVGPWFIYEMRSPDTVARDPDGLTTDLELDDDIFEENAALFRDAHAAAAIAEEKLQYVYSAFSRRNAHNRSDDILTALFIEHLAAIWRILTGREPARASSGPFVEFAAASWKMTNFPIPAHKFHKPKIASSPRRSIVSWIGQRISKHARQQNWVRSRQKQSDKHIFQGKSK